MQPEELRVGNLAQWSEIASMGYGEIKVHVHNLQYAKFMDPIPLKEEHLHEYGFIRGGYDLLEWHHVNHTRINFVGCEDDDEDNTNEWLGWNYNLGDEGDALKSQFYIKYVHQLQNLFYALTGEELKPIKK